MRRLAHWLLLRFLRAAAPESPTATAITYDYDTWGKWVGLDILDMCELYGRHTRTTVQFVRTCAIRNLKDKRAFQ